LFGERRLVLLALAGDALRLAGDGRDAQALVLEPEGRIPFRIWRSVPQIVEVQTVLDSDSAFMSPTTRTA
jgi:hypothetical protein